MKSVSMIAAVCIGLVASTVLAKDDKDDDKIRAKLTGKQEVPYVSTPGSGTFVAEALANGDIHYELTYSGLQADVTQAHIHIGQRGANGAIAIWLCGSATIPVPPGAATQPNNCPLRAGTITGTITAASIRPIAAQGIAANELAEVEAAMRAGFAYANVHTTLSPGGEIRGQLRSRNTRGDDDGKGGGDHKH